MLKSQSTLLSCKLAMNCVVEKGTNNENLVLIPAHWILKYLIIFKLFYLSSFELFNCFSISWNFIKDINLSKAHCSWLSMEVVNAGFGELISWCKAILVFSGNLYEPVGDDLHNFHSFKRSVGKYFPLKHILFRMELNTIERIFLGFERRNKLFILRGHTCGN